MIMNKEINVTKAILQMFDHNMGEAIRFTLADEKEQEKIKEGFRELIAETRHDAHSGTTSICYVPPMIWGACASHRDYPYINGSVGGHIRINGEHQIGSCNYYCGQTIYPGQCRPITEGFQGFVCEVNDGTCQKLEPPKPPEARIIKQ